jgi:uncharacterized protein YndB with AHSA1/START domain
MPNASAIAHSTATPESVFRHLAVAEAWPLWMRLPARARRALAGAPDPNGVGAVRSIFPVKEKVVAYEPNTHYAYVMLTPTPMKNYRADITLTPKDGGTRIEYAASADPRIPGTGAVVAASLRWATKTLARLLASHAERCKADCPAR